MSNVMKVVDDTVIIDGEPVLVEEGHHWISKEPGGDWFSYRSKPTFSKHGFWEYIDDDELNSDSPVPISYIWTGDEITPEEASKTLSFLARENKDAEA